MEIGTTNSVPSDFLPITGLDLTEKIDVNYLNTDSTRMPNDELAGLHGSGEPFPTDGMYSYGKEPPHEPYLSEFVPCDTYCPVQEIWIKESQEFELKHPRGSDGKFISTGQMAEIGDKLGFDIKNVAWDSQDIDSLEISDKMLKPFTERDVPPKLRKESAKLSLLRAMTEGWSKDIPIYDYNGTKKMWREIIENNPSHPVAQKMVEIEERMNTFNKQFHQMANSAKSLWRGISYNELESYVKDGIVGGHKKSRYGYKFVSTSVDPTRASMFGSGVQIEFHADKVRKNATIVEYTPWAQREGNEEPLKQDSGRYSEDVEVRLHKGTSIKGMIKKIYIQTGLNTPDDFRLEPEDQVKLEKLAPVEYKDWRAEWN